MPPQEPWRKLRIGVRAAGGVLGGGGWCVADWETYGGGAQCTESGPCVRDDVVRVLFNLLVWLKDPVTLQENVMCAPVLRERLAVLAMGWAATTRFSTRAGS